MCFWLDRLDERAALPQLCLDENWRGGLEGLPPESVDAGRALVRSQELRDSGIHYLEHQSFCFTTPSGREWIVYGSPAALFYARGSFQYMTYKEAEGNHKNHKSAWVHIGISQSYRHIRTDAFQHRNTSHPHATLRSS